jgi:hypothetical protein
MGPLTGAWRTGSIGARGGTVSEAHTTHENERAETHTPAPAATPLGLHQWKSIPMLLLEVVLITTGVFLGLLGEQWRQNSEHRELATAALKQFHSEFVQNRAEVARVHQGHIDQLKDLRNYFNTNGRALAAHWTDHTKPIPLPAPSTITDSAGVDFSAWDLALATQSLAHIDPQLVADMSAAYRMQQLYVNAHGAIMQTSYNMTDAVFQMNGVMTWLSDSVLYENLMNRRYDDLIPRLEKAIADSD